MSLIELPSQTTLRNELVKYDEDVLKEVYLYYVETGKKKVMQSMLWDELKKRQEIRIHEKQALAMRFGNRPQWMMDWGREWDKVRMQIRNRNKIQGGTQ